MLSWKNIKLKLNNLAKQKFYLYTFVAVLTIIITLSASLWLLNAMDNKTPHFSRAEFLALEKTLTESFDQSDPQKAIEQLEAITVLPRELANRKNYILSRLYYKIDETLLAFIAASEIDKDYIPQYSAYHRIKLAEALGLETTVINELDYLIHLYPKEPKFIYELAKSFARQNNTKQAIETFQKVQQRFPKTHYAMGANYYLANLTNDLDTKISLYKKYLTSSPYGYFSILIVDQINGMDSSIQKQFKGLSNFIALSYYWHDRYQAAAQYFKPELNYPELYIEAYAKTLIKLNRNIDAAIAIKQALPRLKDTELAEEMLNLLLKISGKYSALDILRELKTKAPNLSAKIQWEIASRLETTSGYEEIYKDYPDSAYAAESMARVFFDKVRNSAFDEALKLASEHWGTYPKSQSHSMVAFWAAKIHLERKEKSKAEEILQDIIISHPTDYYAFRAEQVLAKQNKWYNFTKSNKFVSAIDWTWPEIYSDTEIRKLYGKDILELCKLHEYEFILELDDPSFDKNFMMWLYAKAGETLKAISTAYFSLDDNLSADINNIKFQYAFPLLYADIIWDQISLNEKIDPLLVHALIKQESRYQKNIVSKVGAIGLMQLMPYTAKAIAEELKIRNPKVEDLMTPQTNIKLGVVYLEQMMHKFNNNLIYTIASYNAGPVVAKAWQDKFSNYDEDMQVELIPYNETKNYVKKVLSNYWIYRQLYAS